MRDLRTLLLLAAIFAAACAGGADRRTLAELRAVEPDVSEVRVENSVDQAMVGYRKFLAEAPESALTPEAMRRLADLKLEKEYGFLGEGETAQPKPATAQRESDEAFERRAPAVLAGSPFGPESPLELPAGTAAAPDGPLEAIQLYDQILATYPSYAHNDSVLYQKARALDELGRVDEAIDVIERLTGQYPRSRHVREVQFRRAEYFFMRRKYLQAEEGYAAIVKTGAGDEYYELSLYKLGWTFYKQDLLEEALQQYTALLDHKVATGYDFDHARDEDEERRIADTYRVISLCFSSLGGSDVVAQYFQTHGARSYEDRIYAHLAEFYLDKRRYQDAAHAYQAFVGLHPLHRSAPRFAMRVVEVYETGGFPILVLESKKAFAASYGLSSEYWRHFDLNESPQVLAYLKTNLQDLASHYHAHYQNAERAEEKPAAFEEAARWYRAYLASFPAGDGTPGIHYRLADLLLEHQDFGEAAREYERTAYDYPQHEQAAAAGYAAIYAHRESQKRAAGDEQMAVRRQAVASTFRFADRFPAHEHTARALGAAVQDLYDMKEFASAIARARQLIERYPDAELPIRRGAWAVVANASLDSADYPEAERAYTQVLELTAADDASRQEVVDDLAASIYKQGEQANSAGDARAAAAHFLRIGKAAPSSKIRPAAEYDASAALIQLGQWSDAAGVLETLRTEHPEHELQRDATKQLAYVHRQAGNATRAGEEYERVASEAKSPEERREALLVAGELYENAQATDRALALYLGYVKEFPEPLETAVETRFKIAAIQKAKRDDASYRAELRAIVAADASAGDARTARVRYLAAQSALVLTDEVYARFGEIALVQPFESNLREKKRRMAAALDGFEALVDYEVADVTAAATFYMAAIYADFARALAQSERPAGLDAAQLQAYDDALDEQIFPFEEKAIALHQKNLELLASGIYNAWTEKSLGALAELVPGRYAKFEASSGWLASPERYAYESPAALAARAALQPTDAVPAAPEEGANDAPAP